MYRIIGYMPQPRMGGSGFNIILTPKWLEGISKINLTQDDIDKWIKIMAPDILKAHGYNFTSKLHIHDIRIKWGDWGPEHITVPGNACGMDLDTCCVGTRPGEVALTPHNVDSPSQASMLLAIFLWFAEYIELQTFNN